MAIVHQLPLDFAVEKCCTRCGKAQPLTDYHRQARGKDGRKSYCKTCCHAFDVERYAASNKEQERQRARAYYQEHKATVKARALRWYRANSEHVKRRVSRWNQSNRERRRIYNLHTRHRNPAPYRETVRRRYARRKGAATVRFTPAQIQAKALYWANQCWLCGGPHEAWDHVKPLVRGGAHMLCNLRPICRVCNSRKGDKWPYP